MPAIQLTNWSMHMYLIHPYSIIISHSNNTFLDQDNLSIVNEMADNNKSFFPLEREVRREVFAPQLTVSINLYLKLGKF